MQLSEQDWICERERLEKVYKIIDNSISKFSTYLNNVKSELYSTGRSMWETGAHHSDDFDSVIELKHYLDELKHQKDKQEFLKLRMHQIEKLKKSPYFARVDFLEKDLDNTEMIYIGLSSLFYNNDILIYDWRAPISSIFYEYGLGEAEYSCPGGVIEGNILLKRQFKIFGNNISYMFNTDIKIDDEILQETLSKSIDNKMRTIITSIQKEQNRIIRNEKSPILIVQGPAGSGKTSIALHRAAYLLYKFRDLLKADDIIIFSPNQIFSNYISNVLPELGEEDIKQTLFLDYFKYIFNNNIKIENYNSQLESLLSCYDDKRVSEISFKSSQEFICIIKNYINYLNNKEVGFPDVFYENEIIISSEEIIKLYNGIYKAFPYAEKLKLIRERVFTIVEKYLKDKIKSLADRLEKDSRYEHSTRSDVKAIAKSVVKKQIELVKSQVLQFTKYDSLELYKMLFEDEYIFYKVTSNVNLPHNINSISSSTVERINNNIVFYEDIAPVAYLKHSLEIVKENRLAKHVIIDEAQDYSPIQYELFFKCFKGSKMTILGDLNQVIHPYYNIGEFKNIDSELLINSPDIITLNKSYRSTKEISEFCQGIISKSKEFDIMSRSGEKTGIIECGNNTIANKSVISDINCLSENGCKSIAIVCKTFSGCKKVYNYLKTRIDLNLIGSENMEFPEGVVVIPAYLIKGLEFDAVLVYDASEENYFKDDERKLFYTICTRALHFLRIYYVGRPFLYIKDINKNLYCLRKKTC